MLFFCVERGKPKNLEKNHLSKVCLCIYIVEGNALCRVQIINGTQVSSDCRDSYFSSQSPQDSGHWKNRGMLMGQ